MNQHRDKASALDSPSEVIALTIKSPMPMAASPAPWNRIFSSERRLFVVLAAAYNPTRVTGASRIEAQLADRDAHPIGAQIAQPENPFSVRDHDDPHVRMRPVPQHFPDHALLVPGDK